MARWPSGEAEVCKTLHAGSIPARASILPPFFRKQARTVQKHYEIWCDGSYRQAGHTLGGAFVCVAPDGTQSEKSIPYPELKDTHAHGSDIAEMYAFRDALGEVPDQSLVVVHMDCRNVIDWLTTETLSNKDKMREPRVKRAFEDAVAAKKRMRGVNIVYTSDKNSPNMGLAHQLSRKASTPGKKDDRRHRHAHQDSRHPARP